MEWEALLVNVLKDLGLLALLGFLLATGYLWTKGQVNLVIEDKNRQLMERDREIDYWRDKCIQLLQIGEELADTNG